MRQVPKTTRYAILGRGKAARHFSRYFSLLDLNFWIWEDARVLNEAFFSRLSDPSTAPTHIWILVSDTAIEPIAQSIRTRLQKQTPILLHASGVLNTESAIGVHPLYTFGPELYSLETYEKIPFFLSHESKIESLPGIPNAIHRFPNQDRSLYHALAVIAGNFPLALWASVFERLENRLGVSRETVRPYLMQVMENAFRLTGYSNMLTGPRVRGDVSTIEKHLSALEKDELRPVYEALDNFISKRIRKEVEHDHRT